MKPKAKPMSASAHPAARSAESDLVKLAKEFEAITSELKRLDQAVSDHRDSQKAARTNFEIAYNYNEKKIEHIRRQQRTLNSQLENVRELLAPLTRQHHTDVGACLIGEPCRPYPLA